MITKLDHVNLRTRDLDRLVDWYERVLDLRVGPRPDFRFAGAWLYAGDQAIIHIVADDGADRRDGPLTLEHFGLRAKDYRGFLMRLKTNDISYFEAKVSAGEADFQQVNIHDPDGNHIHVDFAMDELS